MIRRPPRSTLSSSSAASDVYKRQLDEYVMTGLRAGASGFLLKDVGPPDLLSAIRAVADGDAVVAPAVTRRLLDRYVRGQGHLVALMPPWTRSRPASTRYSSWSPEHCP